MQENPIADWQTEPSAETIHEEVQTTGRDYETCRAKLRQEMKRDAERLRAAAPAAADEVAGALQAAEQAKSDAQEMVQARAASLDSLEAQILALGNVRQQIRTVQRLSLDKPAAKEMARSALDFYLAKQGRGQCERTESGFRQTVEELAFRSALSPYVGEFVARLEAQAKEIISEIRATANREKFDLGNFLKVLAGDKRPGGLEADATLYDGLLEPPSATTL